MLLALFVLFMLLNGLGYYVTPLTARFRSPLHADLKPGGHIGLTLGMVGTSMMLCLLGYSLRKRVGFMRSWGRLRGWLDFHIFLGVAGPVLITFHTSFKLRGIVAISYWSMIIVALSGLVGRYLYVQIPQAIADRERQLQHLRDEAEQITARLSKLLDPSRLSQVLATTDYRTAAPRFAPLAIVFMFADDIGWIRRRRKLLRLLSATPGTRAEHLEFCRLARSRAVHQRRVVLLQASHRLFRYWHIFHIPLAQTMYITMAIHVGVAIMTGYY